MAARDTQPTEPLPDWEHAEAPRRRVWPWLVAFAIVVVLAVVAWFAAEALARQIVTNVVRDQVRTQLSLPASQQIDVEIDGAVVPQLIGGTLGTLRVSSDDVSLDAFTGDVAVVATDVPVRGGGDIGGATATIAVDEEQLRALLSTVDGFPADSLGLAAPNVTISTDLQLFGATIAVSAALAPSAAAGDIVLTPASVQIAGAQAEAEELRERFGALADAVLRDWTVCIAEYLPAGATLTDVSVPGSELVAVFAVDGGIANDPELRADGTCDDPA